jgi:hypothetical protein
VIPHLQKLLSSVRILVEQHPPKALAVCDSTRRCKGEYNQTMIPEGGAGASAPGGTNSPSRAPVQPPESTSGLPQGPPALEGSSTPRGEAASVTQPHDSPSGDPPLAGAPLGPRDQSEIAGIGPDLGGEGESPSPPPDKRWEHVEGVGACSEGTVSSMSSGMATASPEAAGGQGKRVPALEAEVEQLRRQLHAAIQVCTPTRCRELHFIGITTL